MLIATFVRILEEGGEEGGRGAIDFNRPLKSLSHDRRLNADKLALYESAGVDLKSKQGRGTWVVKKSGLLIECPPRIAHSLIFMMPACVSVLVHRARVNEAATRYVPPSCLKTNTPTPKK